LIGRTKLLFQSMVLSVINIVTRYTLRRYGVTFFRYALRRYLFSLRVTALPLKIGEIGESKIIMKII